MIVDGPRQLGFFVDPATVELAAIERTGLLDVSMGPYFAMGTAVDPTLGDLRNGTVQAITAAMGYAKGIGLRVTLKPIVDAYTYPPGSSGWRNNVLPADPTAWMVDYWNRAIAPYLPFADTVVVSTELDLFHVTFPSHWAYLVEKIRRHSLFHGPISSGGLPGPWQADLDWVGGSYYPTIDTTTVTTAAASWQSYADQMSALSAAWGGQGVYCSELGLPPDAALPNWVDGLRATVGKLPFWRGAAIWRWAQNASTGGQLTPAEQAAISRLAAP